MDKMMWALLDAEPIFVGLKITKLILDNKL